MTDEFIDFEKLIDPNSPDEFVLKQNFPNPFYPTTNIFYQIPSSCRVSVAVYNLHGQLVKGLQNSFQNAGHYSIQWDGIDNLGKEVTSGIYLLKIKAGGYLATKKILFAK